MNSRRWFLKSRAGAALLLVVRPLAAHHSTAMYNMDNPVTVTGTVKRFEWTNPHAFIYLAVKDESGKEVESVVEMMSLNHLRSYGWMHTTVITCTGGPARGGQSAMIASLIKLPDGRMIRS